MNFAEFKNLDILNGYQFTNQQLDTIMNTAAQYEKRVKAGEVIHDLDGCVVASLFFEPSTRTRLSFEAAINRTGAKCISMADAKASSQAKGETLEDTIRTVDGYVDAIVMRHPVKGAAVTAANIAEHPVINGGDGAGQHPTQALLDVVRPELALISVGEGNLYGHPAQETLDRLAALGARVRRTDQEGKLTVALRDGAVGIY